MLVWVCLAQTNCACVIEIILCIPITLEHQVQTWLDIVRTADSQWFILSVVVYIAFILSIVLYTLMHLFLIHCVMDDLFHLCIMFFFNWMHFILYFLHFIVYLKLYGGVVYGLYTNLQSGSLFHVQSVVIDMIHKIHAMQIYDTSNSDNISYKLYVVIMS